MTRRASASVAAVWRVRLGRSGVTPTKIQNFSNALSGVHIALVPLSVQILKPLDLGECLPFGDLLAGQAGVPARPAAEVDGETGQQRTGE